MNRRIAIAAVASLIAVMIVAWWWPSSSESASDPAKGIAAGPAPSPEARSTWTVEDRIAIQETPSTDEQRATITGRVSARGSGLPIARATVTFFLDGAHDALTGVDGTFRFDAPRPGIYELRRIAAEGFAPYEADRMRSDLRFFARPGKTIGGIQFELEPLMSCKGTVTRRGSPVAGARVQCARHELVIGETIANGRGEFEVRCARWYGLTVPDSVIFIPLGDRPECDRDIDLERDALPLPSDPGDIHWRVLKGRVVDERGRPVEHLRVACEGIDPGLAKPDSLRRMMLGDGEFASLGPTDEAGAFQCRVIEGKDVLVSVPGVASAERRFAVGTDDVTLVVPVVGRVRGSVRDFDGRPVPYFSVNARSSTGQWYERTFISADGSFDLGDVVSDLYAVTAVQSGFPPSATEEVEVSPGKDAQVTLILQRGLAVRGIVLDATTHRPISGARVSLPDMDGPSGPVALREPFTLTDVNGRFALNRFLLEGADSLTVSAPGYNTWELGLGEAKLEEVTVELTPTGSDSEVEYGGVGMGFNRQLVVTYVNPTGPAGRAGVSKGDRIVAIDGRPAPEDSEVAIGQIRGLPGTRVEIQFQRVDGGVLATDLRRERIAEP